MDITEFENNRNRSLREELGEIKDLISKGGKKKSERKFFMPLKARFGKGKMKRNYCIVVDIAENKNVNFRKIPIEDGVVRVTDKKGIDTWHSVDQDSVFIYKKKPVIFIARNKINAYNPLSGTNETHGQQYILSKMLKDQLKPKKTIGGMAIFIIIIIAIIAYYLFFKGGAA